MTETKKFEVWDIITWGFLALFVLFLVYPMYGILKQSVFSADGSRNLLSGVENDLVSGK